VQALADQAAHNIAHACTFRVRNAVKFLVCDGRLGAPGYGPFGAIHVGASAASIPPALVAQLAPGGRMVIPIGPRDGAQLLTVVDKNMCDDSFRTTRAFSVRYVPLCDVNEQVTSSPPPPPP
jgi:protein-L-isoaspartate(D-aspartate) O-methyltransferase